jgi:O-antigen/teichoic acid export membrane protein
MGLLKTSAPRLLVLTRRLMRHDVVRNNAIFLAGSVAAGFFGYAFHFIVGRMLGPTSYAVVAAAIAGLYLLTLPALAIQLVAARFASLASAHGNLGGVRPLLRQVNGLGLLIGGAIAVIVIAGGHAVALFLQLASTQVVVVLAISAMLGLLVSGTRGVLQGLRRFYALSANVMLDTGTRIVVAVALLLSGLGPIGAVLALTAGPALAYGQSFLLLRGLPARSPEPPIPLGQVLRYAAPVAVAVGGVTYLFNVDVLLAKHFLTPHAAGLYAAGSVLGRVVYFLGLTVAGVMFPEVAARHARDEAHYHVVDLSLGLVAGVGLALIAVYALLPGIVLSPYGAGFTGVKPYLWPFALGLTLLATANLLVNYFLSVNSTRFIAPLLGACVLETVLILAVHGTPAQILAMLVLTMVVLILALAVVYAVERRSAAARQL